MLPYDEGDHFAEGVLSMLYPGYVDSGYFRDERGFLSPTPYGDIADCILADTAAWQLDRYGVVVLVGEITPGAEMRDTLSLYTARGGHLVMTAGEFYGTNVLERYGIEPEVSLKPDFVVPVYPVVTLSDSRYVHRRSRLGLLGEWTVLRESMRDSLSLERHVRPDGPPVFLLNCIDDPIVDYHNSVLLDSALTASGVAHRYVQMQTGGHGFGADASRQNEETSAWQGLFLQWLDENIL